MPIPDIAPAKRRPLRSRRWFWPFTILGLLSNAALALTATEVIAMSEPVRLALIPAYAIRLAVSIPFIAIARIFDIGPGYWPYQWVAFLSIAPFVLLDALVRRVHRTRKLMLIALFSSLGACAAHTATAAAFALPKSLRSAPSIR